MSVSLQLTCGHLTAEMAAFFRRVRTRCVLILLLVRLCSAVKSAEQNSKLIWGAVPRAAARNPLCANFTTACTAEAEGRLAEAFSIYESLYITCGDLGWGDMGTGTGARSVVLLRTTPCGLPVVVKRSKSSIECDVLQLATTAASTAACPGCFPRCYYYGNTTLGTYIELLPNETIPLVNFFKYPPHIHTIKSLFLQGLSAIKLLRSVGWEHNDLGKSNMWITRKINGDGTVHYKLALFDLGFARPVPVEGTADDHAKRWPRRLPSSNSVADGRIPSHLQTSRPGRHLTLNGPYTDTYTLAKAFYTLAIYFGRHSLHSDIPPVYNMATLESALWDIMMMLPDRFCEPNFTAIKSRLRSAATLATVTVV